MARNDDDDDDNKRNDESDVGLLMNNMVIFGGCEVGYNTNPKTEKESCFIEVGGQKIVCLAQGGECRYNHNYFSWSLNDKKSWTTPIIAECCPDTCSYKVLVCDDHDEKCEGSIRYHPQYNKFYGQFKRYCRNFDKFINGTGKRKGKKIEAKIKITHETGKFGEINSYYELDRFE
jgi:hypothetical protein